jgi:hypothetical protein
MAHTDSATTGQDQHILPLELVLRILTLPWQDETHASACETLIGELTEHELEVAARTSYVYWVAVTTYPTLITSDIRKRSAMKEARRHFVGEGLDHDKALLSLRETLDFRRKYQLDLLRTCMVPDYPNYTNDESALTAARYRAYIQEEARHQTNVVRGHDKMSRCIVLKLERRSAQHDQETFFIAHLYLIERAIATTEVLSEGREEKCLGIGDFGTYQSAYAPSRQALVALMDVLQRHYPERLQKMILLDPPFWMRSLYSILRVFLRSETREKIAMVSGMVRCQWSCDGRRTPSALCRSLTIASKSNYFLLQDEKEAVLGRIIDADQATPFILPGGTLDSPVDMERFLNNIPFHSLYDDGSIALST